MRHVLILTIQHVTPPGGGILASLCLPLPPTRRSIFLLSVPAADLQTDARVHG